MTKVSVIIPVYNKEKYVKETLESVLKQTHKDVEILVMNDASTDNSRQVILDIIKEHPEIIFIDEKNNLGVCKARNKLIDMASGKYILPLDADDIIDKTYIEKAANALNNNPDYSVVYCNFKHFGSMQQCNYTEFDYENIIFKNCIVAGSMFRKADFYKAGCYKEWLNDIGGEDWELWISFTEKDFKFYKLNEVLYFYRVLGAEFSLICTCRKNINLIRKLILEHHISMYLKNKKFIDRVMDDDFCRFEKFKVHAKKYKKLFNILLPICIIELMSGIIMLAYFCFQLRGGGKLCYGKL